MNLQVWILLTGLLSLLSPLADAAADIVLVDGTVTLTGGYVTGTTPSALTIKTTHTQAVSTGSIVYTFSENIFAVGTPTCTPTLSTGSVTVTCTTSNSGATLSVSVDSGSVGAGETLTLAISSDIAVLDVAGTSVSMSSLTANGGADTLNGGSTVVFVVVPTATVSLTSANLNAGTLPTQLQVTFKNPFALAGSQVIELGFNKAVFPAGQSTGASFTGATVGSYTTSDTATFQATLSAVVAADTTIVITLAAPIVTSLPNSAGAVTVTIKTNNVVSHDAQTGFGTIVSTGGGPGVGADPFTHFGNVTRGFELPLHTLTPLLRAPDLVIHGSVFPGNPTEQWFDRIVFSTPDESRWLEVKVKKNLEDVNASRVPEWVFRTLDVSLGYGSISEPLAKTSLHVINQKIPFNFLGQEIVFRQMQRHHWVRFSAVGGFRRECVTMAGTSLHLFLCSAPAHEYHGPLHHLALRYIHLDLAIIEAVNLDELTGLLPELWGIRPMSETTKAYLKEDHPETPTIQFREEENVSKAWIGDSTENINSTCSEQNETAWIGGIGMENITRACLEQNENSLSVSM